MQSRLHFFILFVAFHIVHRVRSTCAHTLTQRCILRHDHCAQANHKSTAQQQQQYQSQVTRREPPCFSASQNVHSQKQYQPIICATLCIGQTPSVLSMTAKYILTQMQNEHIFPFAQAACILPFGKTAPTTKSKNDFAITWSLYITRDVHIYNQQILGTAT